MQTTHNADLRVRYLLVAFVLFNVALVVISMMAPEHARTHQLVACSPAIVVSVFALWQSPKRLRTVGILGIFVGYAIVTATYFEVCFGQMPTFWESVEHEFHQIGRPTGIAAVAAAVLDTVLRHYYYSDAVPGADVAGS